MSVIIVRKIAESFKLRIFKYKNSQFYYFANSDTAYPVQVKKTVARKPRSV